MPVSVGAVVPPLPRYSLRSFRLQASSHGVGLILSDRVRILPIYPFGHLPHLGYSFACVTASLPLFVGVPLEKRKEPNCKLQAAREVKGGLSPRASPCLFWPLGPRLRRFASQAVYSLRSPLRGRTSCVPSLRSGPTINLGLQAYPDEHRELLRVLSFPHSS